MHTLRLEGELSVDSAPVLEEAIELLCERRVAVVALNLRGLTALDWVGVRVIAFRRELLSMRGHELRLFAVPPWAVSEFEREGCAETLLYASVEEQAPDPVPEPIPWGRR